MDKNTIENETWKPVKGYEGLYEVSDLGRVKKSKLLCLNQYILFWTEEKILKPRKNNRGYLRIALTKNKSHKVYLVHRLVAEAFIPNPNNLPMVNHKDENPLNNISKNLEWCDSKYDNNYGTKKIRASKAMTNGKLSKPVLQYTLDGKLVKEWVSIKEASRDGFDDSSITLCCKGKYKQHKGYIWKHKI